MGSASFALRLAAAGSLPRGRDTAPVRIGFLAPLSGPESGWGRPGLAGAELWAEEMNDHGGLTLGGRTRRIEIVARDSALSPETTFEAARELIELRRARLILTLGGDTLAPALPWLMARRALVATLLPSDLGPDTPSLIAPAELHPLFNVTGVEWLARNRPALKRVALCAQTDSLGLPSLAVYRAAFEVAGFARLREIRYSPDDHDADGIVAAMLQDDPEVLCWCSSAPPMIAALTEAAHTRGFRGEIIACTADDYPKMIARTSAGFMARYTFQFPDFDDPMLADTAFFFRNPRSFFDSYTRRFPGLWSAVSWEYASILDLWHGAAEVAGSADPVRVLSAMQRGQKMPHIFGPAEWWGAELYGIDNALVGDWPVVRLREGRARIAEFGSVLGWLGRHHGVLMRHMADLGQSWQHRARGKIADQSSSPSRIF